MLQVRGECAPPRTREDGLTLQPQSSLLLWSLAPSTPFGKSENGDPFPYPLGRLSAPRRRYQPPVLPHRGTVPKTLTGLPIRSSPFRERARGLGGPGTAPAPAPSACSRRAFGEPQPPVPLHWMERRPTRQPAKFARVRALPGTPAGREPGPTRLLCSPPDALRAHITCCRRAGAGTAEGWEVRRVELAPPFPNPHPQLSGRECAQLPAGSTGASCARDEDTATHRAPGPAPASARAASAPSPRSLARLAPAHE